MSQSIIELWIGSDLITPSSLIIAMALFVVISAWNNVFAMIVNGAGKIRPQMYSAIIAMLINIPLSIMLAKEYSLGLSGIVAGTICSLSLAAVVLPIQVWRMTKQRV
jgi:Na+-driven multidrug efflux pump